MAHIFGSLGVVTQSAIVCISLIGVALHVRRAPKSTSLGRTVLTTFGIFWCFWVAQPIHRGDRRLRFAQSSEASTHRSQ
jgi:succinate-acetate transporter protein